MIDRFEYEPERLIDNKDMIDKIICLGCSKTTNIKQFIEHCKNCRILNRTPSCAKQKDSLNFRVFSNNRSSRDLNFNSEIEFTQVSKQLGSPTQANTSNVSPLARSKVLTARSPNSKLSFINKSKNNDWRYNYHFTNVI